MQETQTYDRDFWKHAKLRKLWDEIVPGEPRKTIPYALTKQAIQDYCRSVGDMHPLYFDEVYAQKSIYGGLIAPPAIHSLLLFACLPMEDWIRTPGHINVGQTWNYHKPARPGDTITLQARALDKFIKKERLFVIHDNVFLNQNGEVTAAGRGWSIGQRESKIMSSFFEQLTPGAQIAGTPFAVTRESIRAFADATLDHNPLHLDDEFMQGDFGKTKFGSVIMHGMTSYGLIARMLTDWAFPQGGMLRRMEARWVVPVRPGDLVQAHGTVRAKRVTDTSRWVVVDFNLTNQGSETVSRGEALVEFPPESAQ